MADSTEMAMFDLEVRLRASEMRVQELLEANTRLVEERRLHDEQMMVGHFHRMGGYPVRHSPHVPEDEEVRFRLRLIAEEFFEMLEACFTGIRAPHTSFVDVAKDHVRQVIDGGHLTVNLEEIVDAWADMKYVIVGSEVAFGVDGNAVFRVVHASNLLKFGPGAWRDEQNKARKPPGWVPPDIAGELERQRREEAKRT